MTEYEKILSSPLIVKNGYIRVHSYAGEPNYYQEFYNDNILRVIRNRDNGYLCGYVGVHEGYEVYKKNYSELNDKSIYQVHGGLTFSNYMKNLSYNNLWYIGFDCNHYADLCPIAHPGLTRLLETSNFKTYKTFGFVMSELYKLSDSLY
jgi:hypothetical protein